MHKSFPAKIKAVGTEDGLAEGQFRALVSVFGNKDAMGDVVMPGAFTDTLAQWAASGDRIPVWWSHQMQDPDFNVGWVDEASETPDGLEVLASLDLEEGASPKAKQVHRLMKGRRVTQFSFAYDVVDAGAVEKDGDSYTELRALKLYEVGPTPIGANSETELLAVKQMAEQATAVVDGLKRGRVLSSKNESVLKEALGSITASASSIKSVLASVASEDGDEPKANQPQEKASTPGPATAKEPSQATAQEPTRGGRVASWAAHLTVLDLEGT